MLVGTLTNEPFKYSLTLNIVVSVEDSRWQTWAKPVNLNHWFWHVEHRTEQC